MLRNRVSNSTLGAAGGCGKTADTLNLTRSRLLCASLVTLLALQGCQVGKTLDAKSLDTSVTTASIAPAISDEVAKDGIMTTDTQVIKQAVISAQAAPADSNLMSWQNPETGAKGTIVQLDNVVNENGQACKKFRTTVDTFMGISLYDGETCELRRGMWVLSLLAKHT